MVGRDLWTETRLVDGVSGIGQCVVLGAGALSPIRTVIETTVPQNWVAVCDRQADTGAMVVVIGLLVLLVALGVATVLGWTADTRDPDYSLGRIVAPRAPEAGRADNGDAPPPP
jgi:hypothetical protein